MTKENKICKNCVLDTSVKEIQFSFGGVCNFCRDYPARERERKLEKQNLPWIIYNIKKSGKCLLGLSGGVDSSMCLHFLKEQGITPFCFSMDNGWNTKIADENILKLVEGVKAPLERFVINKQQFNKLQQAFLMSGVPNVEIPTDHCLMALSYEYAAKHGIKYIISGGNLATESIMPLSWSYNARDLTHIKDIYKQMIGEKLTGLPTISLWKYIYYRFIKGIKVINLLDYYEYNRENSIKLLKELYGYASYGEKHEENDFTKWFQGYYLPYKHGIDKRKAHFSSLILSGQMTKEQALSELSKPLEYKDLKLDRFIGRSKQHSDYKCGEKWWQLASKIYAYTK